MDNSFENFCGRVGWESWVKGVGDKMLLEIVWKKRLARLGGKFKWTNLTGKLCWKTVWNNQIDNLVDKLDDQFGGQI